MRILLLFVTFFAGSTAWCASELPADKINIAALNCEFLLPTSYTVRISNDYGVSVESNDSRDRAVFTFASLDVSLTDKDQAPIASEQRGPLAIERYEVDSGRSEPAVIHVTLIRGLSQQLMVFNLPPQQVERHIAHCIETMRPAVVAASERRANGCASELPLQTLRQSVLGTATWQPVFSGGRLTGSRIYGLDANGPLIRAGISEGTLLTHICDVPFDELIANPDNVCCASDASLEISATFLPNRGEPKTVLIKRGT